VFIENSILLISGIFCGIISAFIAILPSFLLARYNIQLGLLIPIILLLIFIGMLWIAILIRNIMKGNLIETLRNY
jgi:hypothetical protein